MRRFAVVLGLFVQACSGDPGGPDDLVADSRAAARRARKRRRSSASERAGAKREAERHRDELVARAKLLLPEALGEELTDGRDQ